MNDPGFRLKHWLGLILGLALLVFGIAVATTCL